MRRYDRDIEGSKISLPKSHLGILGKKETIHNKQFDRSLVLSAHSIMGPLLYKLQEGHTKFS